MASKWMGETALKETILKLLKALKDKSDALTKKIDDGIAALTTQINGKADKTHNHDGTYVKKAGDIMTGNLTVPQLIDSGLTANTVVTANGSKQLASSATTAAELGYVHGVTSAIQTQLNAKLNAANVTNNLTTTAAGYALDARQGKALLDLINGLLATQSFSSSDVTIGTGNTDYVKQVEINIAKSGYTPLAIAYMTAGMSSGGTGVENILINPVTFSSTVVNARLKNTGVVTAKGIHLDVRILYKKN